MKRVTADAGLVACCGLYCGACGKFLRGRCAGCHGNARATWCKVRSCNIARKQSSCAECVEYPDARACRKFNNFISQAVGFVLRSDRGACIAQIRDRGLQGHAERMASLGRPSLKP